MRGHLRKVGILLLGLLPSPVWACSCLWQGSFADIVTNSTHVVHGSIETIKGNSIDLRVIANLKGDSYFDTIRLWGNTGDLCRAEVDQFDLNEEWIFALTKIDEVPDDGFNPMTPNLSFGRVGDYALPGCGGYFLKVHEGWVSGPIIDTTRWDFEPDITPILLQVLAGFVDGSVSRQELKEATEVDPALRELMINTRLHIKR